MIINSAISGGGGSDSEFEVYAKSYTATQTLTIAQLFNNYDIRFKYKNSILWVVAHHYLESPSSSGATNMLAIVNVDNFNNESGYNPIIIYRTGTRYFYWSGFTVGDKAVIDKGYFSADGTTGRISCTATTTYPIAQDGSKFTVWEVPISYAANSTGIDTTAWGS